MLRLSNHFLLLDFLYDQSTLDCVACCGDSLANRVSSFSEDSVEFVEGRNLCATILERVVQERGPISIGAGLWFKDLCKPKNAHDDQYGLGPHKWQHGGAAADIVVHSWVNEGKDPKHFLKTLPGSDIEYHRIIPYRGSEFCCLASRSAGNAFRPGVTEWDKLKESVDIEALLSWSPTNWRRSPYTHSHGSRLRHNERYERRLRKAESIWTKNPAVDPGNNGAASVVYGRMPPMGRPLLDHSIVEVPEDAFDGHPVDGRRLVRPWHVRVSETFVLLDFCRSENMLERGIATVPPLTHRTANTVIKVARMFGEILDPVKKHLGNVSVVRGMEPEGFANDERMRRHRWIPGPGNVHSVEFVTPIDPGPGYLELLPKDRCEVVVERDSVCGGDRVRVGIRDFTPQRCYSSAAREEYAWTG